MINRFEPPPGATGRDQAGGEVPLALYHGCRIKRAWLSKRVDGFVVVALDVPGGPTAHVLVSSEIYRSSVRAVGKKGNTR